MSRRARPLGAVLLLGAVLIGGFWIANRPPVIPADAARTVIGRTSTTGGHGQACLERQAFGPGWADVCWSVDRAEESDGSTTQDYYELRVYGSFEGLKWLVVRADLVGTPNAGAYTSWPDVLIEGDCHSVDADRGPIPGSPRTEMVCGRVTGELDSGAWAQTFTWMCELCLLPVAAMKPLVMNGQVAVDQGTTPEWDLSLQGGG